MPETREIKIKSKLPTVWNQKKLGDIFSVVTGNTPSKSDNSFYGHEYPFFKPTDLEQGITTRFSKDGLSKEGLKAARFIPSGSILVTCIGATIGKTGLSTQDGSCNQQINAILPNPNINSKFAFYQIISNSFQDLIKKNASSTTLPILNKSKFNQLPFIYPPLPEQHRIVQKIEELFSELDNAIATLKTTQQQLQTYRQSVLKHAFEGHFTGGMEGWDNVELDNISSAINGFAFKSELFSDSGKYQVVRMGNIKQGGFKLDEKKVFINTVPNEVIAKSALRKGDIVITLTGTRTKKDYGYVTIVNNEENLLLNQRLAIIRLSDQCCPKFYLYNLMTDSFRDQFFANETGNVGQGNVGINGIRKSTVPLPNFEEQEQIVFEIETRLSESDYLLQTINQQLTHAESLRQSILQRAFSGEL